MLFMAPLRVCFCHCFTEYERSCDVVELDEELNRYEVIIEKGTIPYNAVIAV